jgi:hypothetical protein
MTIKPRFPHPPAPRPALLAALVLLCGSPALRVAAQEPVIERELNFLLPIGELERLLASEPFQIIDWRGARRPEDRTQRVTLAFDDSVIVTAQWAAAPRGGGTFNNQPRYELAAYAVQKLFLDEPEYVVPPTVIRAFPLAFVQEHVPGMRATFNEAPGSVVVALQYWLLAVRPDNVWDVRRARADSVYARHMANLNILTYIINHADANIGNVLISESLDNPRVYAVDNGVAFASQPSDRGDFWRHLHVERVPRRTLDRLRSVTRADLDRALGVLAEFEVRDGVLVQVEPGQNMSTGRGVRRSDQRIQFGLTSTEIRGVEQRIRSLLREANGRQIF